MRALPDGQIDASGLATIVEHALKPQFNSNHQATGHPQRLACGFRFGWPTLVLHFGSGGSIKPLQVASIIPTTPKNRMQAPRPTYLNLLHIRLPVAGVMSILHRASGLLMFLLIPLLLYLLDQSLQSPERFAAVAALFHGATRWLLAPVIWALCHHLLAGIHFLLLDIDIGLERATMRASAGFVNITAALLTLALSAVLLL